MSGGPKPNFEIGDWMERRWWSSGRGRFGRVEAIERHGPNGEQVTAVIRMDVPSSIGLVVYAAVNRRGLPYGFRPVFSVATASTGADEQ